MVPSDSAFPFKAVGYALLSQTIWLPLVAIDLHDRWTSRADAPDAVLASGPRSGVATAGLASPPPGAASAGLFRPSSTGLLLGSASRSGGDPVSGTIEQSIDRPASHGALVSGGGNRPSLLGPGLNPALVPTQAVTANQLLMREYGPSELLGGALGLNDIQAPTMPALAMAERARWAGSSDPLAPLPIDWREPMRRALGTLPGQSRSGGHLETARIVHVPSNRIRTSTDVPLALQSDGSVDILSKPDDPAVVDEIRTWSRRQQAPAAGNVTPAVVRLHPMPQAMPAGPAAAGPPPAAPQASAAPAPPAAVSQAPAIEIAAPMAAPAAESAAPAPAP
jgi:hypothetical protein